MHPEVLAIHDYWQPPTGLSAAAPTFTGRQILV
jgi:hypothetical protein